MRSFSRTTQFKKDVKRAEKRGKSLAKLRAAIDLLIAGEPLPAEYKDHPLRGDFVGSRDCHIEPDWILIYTFTEKDAHVRFERTDPMAIFSDKTPNTNPRSIRNFFMRTKSPSGRERFSERKLLKFISHSCRLDGNARFSFLASIPASQNLDRL